MAVEVESRTMKSAKNIRVALLFYFMNLVINFFLRKSFIEYLGPEILGLNTTATSLLGLLNLAELGIGVAISYTLYKPLFEHNIQKICEIVSVQGWFYRKIAFFVLIVAFILMLLFPAFFAKSHLPLWYAYATFSVLLINALSSYIFNYKQIVLVADQKEYKITLNIQGVKFVKVIIQIFAIIYLKNGYIYWLILEFAMSFITILILNRIIHKEYPWLKVDISKGKIYKKKYPQIIEKTKQLFYHKIGDFVLSQTSPLIIYAYASLTLVAIYGNYMLIVTGVTIFVNSIFNSMIAGVGSLVAEGNKEKIYLIFKEIFAAKIWIAFVVCFGIYQLSSSFISLWIGETYLLDFIPLVLIVAYTFINLTRISEIFAPAYGLYQDIWAPLIEACLNLGCSILLGYFWGLTGILIGILISLVLVIGIWKPYFLFRKGLCISAYHYFFEYLKYIFVGGCAWEISEIISSQISVDPYISYGSWFIYSILIVSIFGLMSFLFFYIFSFGMRMFVKRLFLVILKK